MPAIKDRLQQDKVIEILEKEVKQKEQRLNLKGKQTRFGRSVTN